MNLTTTTTQPPISRLHEREKRTAQATIRIGGEQWIVALDGPNLGPMVMIYRSGPASGWQLWGTAVWLDERIEHRTARLENVDRTVTALLTEALRRVLGRSAS